MLALSWCHHAHRLDPPLLSPRAPAVWVFIADGVGRELILLLGAESTSPRSLDPLLPLASPLECLHVNLLLSLCTAASLCAKCEPASAAARAFPYSQTALTWWTAPRMLRPLQGYPSLSAPVPTFLRL